MDLSVTAEPEVVELAEEELDNYILTEEEQAKR